jgi:hypothetical protein
MRTYALIDLLIAFFAGGVGIISVTMAVGIWRYRNGGMLTRALVGKMCAFGLWGALISIEGLVLWKNATPVSMVSQFLADMDRLILSVPMAVILLWIIPKAAKQKEHGTAEP